MVLILLKGLKHLHCFLNDSFCTAIIIRVGAIAFKLAPSHASLGGTKDTFTKLQRKQRVYIYSQRCLGVKLKELWSRKGTLILGGRGNQVFEISGWVKEISCLALRCRKYIFLLFGPTSSLVL